MKINYYITIDIEGDSVTVFESAFDQETKKASVRKFDFKNCGNKKNKMTRVIDYLCADDLKGE